MFDEMTKREGACVSFVWLNGDDKLFGSFWLTDDIYINFRSEVTWDKTIFLHLLFLTKKSPGSKLPEKFTILLEAELIGTNYNYHVAKNYNITVSLYEYPKRREWNGTLHYVQYYDEVAWAIPYSQMPFNHLERFGSSKKFWVKFFVNSYDEQQHFHDMVINLDSKFIIPSNSLILKYFPISRFIGLPQ